MTELTPDQARQYIDAVATFEALEDARREARSTEGGMYWHAGPPSNPEARYLVRTSRTGAERSLGPRSPETEQTFESFTRRKKENDEQVKALQGRHDQDRRLNRALRVGRVEPLVVKLLNRLADTQLAEHFRIVGTHALYAYEAAAGVRLDAEVLSTRDIDLLWDTQKRVTFATKLARVDSSMLGVLRKVDPSFRLRSRQLYTAVNKDGFEVDIMKAGDAGDLLLPSNGFSQVVVATNGTMARMNTLHPATFVKLKLHMAQRSDVLQADAVQLLLGNYLPQFNLQPQAATA
jgi:hypothetical protein